MKAKVYLTLFTAILFTFSACGSKYTIDISDMPQEQKESHEQKLQDAIEKYESTDIEVDKLNHALEIGYEYLTLGKYDKAIPYFEEILISDGNNYQALANLAYMYEEVGEIEKALEYTKIAWESYYYKVAEVNRDYVNLLLKNDQHEEAKNAVDMLAETDFGKENPEFVQELYEKIEE